jgi:hypothetical protein
VTLVFWVGTHHGVWSNLQRQGAQIQWLRIFGWQSVVPSGRPDAIGCRVWLRSGSAKRSREERSLSR